MNATAHHTGIIKVGNSRGIRFPKDYLKSLGKDVVLEKTNEQNTVTGNHSAILGGSGNSVTHNWAAAFGNGVNSAMDNAFHTEEIALSNLPDGSVSYGGLPTGALYFLAVGTGVGSKTVYIK